MREQQQEVIGPVHSRNPNEGAVSLALVHTAPDKPQPIPSKVPALVAFDRRELALILNVYGRKVAAGEWRDYAMDFLKERAVFSIYARVSERPLFIIEKSPRLRNRQGQYSVTNQQGRILKRGQELSLVLRVLDPQLAVVG
ncbi:MAG: hypothetical protein JWP99_1731 [Devosia sp.]|nr:hypothetical protein [Devosia sp.]